MKLIKLTFIVLILSLSFCSRGDYIEKENFSIFLFSDNYEYSLYFENSINDSIRIDKFKIFRIKEDKQIDLRAERAIFDSLYINHGIVYEGLSDPIDLNIDANLIRDMRVIYYDGDIHSDSYFTEQSFVWDIDNKFLEFKSTGLIIMLE
jgi:hypothetical protein